MSNRTSAWLAWGLSATFWSLIGFALFFRHLINQDNQDRGTVDFISDIALVLAFGATTTIGAFVAWRKNDNAVGWLLLYIGFFPGLTYVGGNYAVYAIQTNPGSLPFAVGVAWISNVAYYPGFWSLIVVFALFPDGRLPSPRWRIVVWTITVGVALSATVIAIRPGPLQNMTQRSVVVDNPLGVMAPGALLDGLGAVALVLLVLGALGSVAALTHRFRHARGVARQQLKWFSYGGAIAIALILVALTPAIPDGSETVVYALAIVIIPVTAGVAVFRYGLYGIDVFVNRTLVYGLLSAILASIFFGMVIGLQAFFRWATDQTNDVAIVISTLAIAGLVVPLRRRIQAAVDRRFYRSKYDAERTVREFGDRVRDEVNLNSLSVDLLGTVDGTVNPSTASLWIRRHSAGSEWDPVELEPGS